MKAVMPEQQREPVDGGEIRGEVADGVEEGGEGVADRREGHCSHRLRWRPARRIGRMAEYVLDHHLDGERARLALMSQLLDPMHRRHLEALGAGPGTRALEVGCGNGSVSAWLAERVVPGGRAVAVDLDLSLVDARAPGLELRRGRHRGRPDRAGRLRPGDRAGGAAPRRRRGRRGRSTSSPALAPGGAILLIEPDFLPVSIAEPPGGARVLGRVARVVARPRDRLSPRPLRWPLGSRRRASSRSPARRRPPSTPAARRGRSTGRGRSSSCAMRWSALGTLDDALVDGFLARCADPAWWTQTIAFTAVHGRAPAGG